MTNSVPRRSKSLRRRLLPTLAVTALAMAVLAITLSGVGPRSLQRTLRWLDDPTITRWAIAAPAIALAIHSVRDLVRAMRRGPEDDEDLQAETYDHALELLESLRGEESTPEADCPGRVVVLPDHDATATSLRWHHAHEDPVGRG